LPSVALGKEETAKKWSAKASLPSVFCRALGKDFAECLILLSAKKMGEIPWKALKQIAFPSMALEN
jgi:hypothetical protein